MEKLAAGFDKTRKRFTHVQNDSNCGTQAERKKVKTVSVHYEGSLETDKF
jgi:FKBP-type peptidyl-prolyl cis-trans isomerase